MHTTEKTRAPENRGGKRGARLESRRVRIEDLHISFGATEVLRGINLEIAAGELFAFLGPSGSGKSTLLRAIAGFGPHPRGRILIGDEDVTTLPPWERNVGMVFQNYALWPHMTVWENVAFGLKERGVPRAEIARRTREALELVGLVELANRRPSQLSGGQQQRVALARTIVVRPQVLLLDEPLSNLDANLRVQMRRELRRLQRELGITTVFVTHDQEEANTLADTMAVLEGGVIQQVGPPMELYDEPANLFVAGFLGAANRLEGRVVARDGGKWFEGPAGFALPVAAEEPEGAAHAVFRPQAARLLAAEAKACADEVCVPVRIAHAEFLGPVVRYAVMVGEHEVLVDEPHLPGKSPRAEGDEASLSVRRETVRVLRA